MSDGCYCGATQEGGGEAEEAYQVALFAMEATSVHKRAAEVRLLTDLHGLFFLELLVCILINVNLCVEESRA